jgi:hypothetical protein
MMAHVRHVNTLGFPDAGVEEEGYFSVVISSRTGRVEVPDGVTAPQPQIVHLVSLEHYDSTLKDLTSGYSSSTSADRVGMISLYSWTYNCTQESVNFVDTMQAIANDMQPLKSPQSTLDALLKNASQQPTFTLQRAAEILHGRLDKGYTIARWRTSTGEETMAFNRGPLVPTQAPGVPAKLLENWPKVSMTGKDYQIYDRDLGVMDLTYSSAWSLGKLAAISDSPFNAALLRFRSLIWSKASSTTRLLINNIPTQATVLRKSTAAVKAARSITPSQFNGAVSRTSPLSTDDVAPALSHPAVTAKFATAIQQAVDRYSSTVTGELIYNDFGLQQAANSDWELIHGWISDCLYLAHIPGRWADRKTSQIQY